ncbi:MAG: dephospho-CoA kinase [Vulcanimicrobiaceae bacterium]
MRLRVGLSGGIGAGKSSAAEIFRELGALVIDADALARAVVARPGEPYRAIAERWPQALRADGEIERSALAAIVFRDPSARVALEAIVHPAVRERGRALEASAAPEQIVIHEVPLLFESGFWQLCDANAVVVAEKPARIARVVARSGLALEEIERRMRAQIDPARATELADYTIRNDGSPADLRHAVREVYDDLGTRIPTVSSSP